MKLLPANQYKSYKGKYSKEEYIAAIIAMNGTLGDILAQRNYFFTLPRGLGYLTVKVIPRTPSKAHIDYGASFKQKQALIDEGKLPLKHYRDKDNNIVGDNGGEEWMVFRTDSSYRLCKWVKKWQYAKNRNTRFFSFRAAGGRHPEAFKKKISLAS